jgi:hypothetical protein
LPDFDVQAPLMSLPMLLGTTVESTPAKVPYLAADPTRAERWHQRLEAIPGFKVGVVWQGNRHFSWDGWRSFALAALAPIAAVEGVQLVSLQKGHGADQVRTLKGSCPVEELDGLDAEGGAFLDSAAVMKKLDLVVTADTASAHLAGALGVPVWVALSTVSDWRWMRDREDTPWYPSMRLFQQRSLGEWDEVFAHMAAALRPLVAKARGSVVRVDVSPGELLDKISILEIKSDRIRDAAKVAKVRRELASLLLARDAALSPSGALAVLAAELRAVNAALWDVEDALRRCERDRDFGEQFVELARSVYRLNDERTALKRRIDERLGAPLGEQKEYPS